jgi:hypothetical protein
LEAATVLVLRYLDGECSAEEIEQLRGALTGSATYRELFVQVCRVQGELHEAYAPKRAGWHRKGTNAAQASPVAVAAGQEAGGTTTLKEIAGGGDDSGIPEHPEKTGDRDAERGSSADAPDAGAETDIRQLSGEDTHFPKDKPPDK